MKNRMHMPRASHSWMFVGACLLLWSAGTANATPIQNPRLNETPDPYFNEPAKPKSVKPIVKPNEFPSEIPKLGFSTPATNQLHKPPTIVPTNDRSDEQPAPGIWNAPLTPSNKLPSNNSSSNNSSSNNSSSNNLSSNKLGSADPWDAPRAPSNSIIRERPRAGAWSTNTPVSTTNPPLGFGPTSGSGFGKSNPVASNPVASNPITPQNGFSFGQSPQSNTNSGIGSPGIQPNDGFPKTDDAKNEPDRQFGDSAAAFAAQEKKSQMQNLMGESVFDGTDFLKTKPSPQKNNKQTNTDNEPSQIQGESFESGKVLALVGGEPIFQGDLMFEINQLIERSLASAPESVKERERKKLIPVMLPGFVENKILFLGGMKVLPEQVTVDQALEQAGKEFDDQARDKIMENSGIKSIMEFDAHLRAQGSSLRQMRRSWSQKELTKFFLSQQLRSSAAVTHQEMLDKYHENIESYSIPAKARWEQIMIRKDRVGSTADAKEQLVKLGNEIVYGAKLDAVARKSSHGFQAADGGQHDWTSKNALVWKEIDKAIFSLPIGELSNIIETQDGFHIVRVTERTEATRTPFLEAQVKIKEDILAAKREEGFKKHLATLKDEIPVEYFTND